MIVSNTSRYMHTSSTNNVSCVGRCYHLLYSQLDARIERSIRKVGSICFQAKYRQDR